MRRAPSRLSASAACTSVPAVSIMSSMMIASLPLTSPMMYMTTATFGPSRRLSMMARPAWSRLAMARARSTPPASGETTTGSDRSALREVVDHDRRREEVVDGDVEEALDLPGVEVEREDALRARGGDQVGHELGRDRHARLHLAVLAGVAVVRAAPP